MKEKSQFVETQKIHSVKKPCESFHFENVFSLRSDLCQLHTLVNAVHGPCTPGAHIQLEKIDINKELHNYY